MESLLNALISAPDRTNAVAAVANVIIATVALFVAVAAIFVSWRTLKSQKIHNELSVRPVAHITLFDLHDEFYIHIENNGTGPLIIKDFFFYDEFGKRFDDLTSILPKLPQGLSWTNYAVINNGRSIRPGDKLVIIHLEIERNTKKYTMFRDDCRKLLSKMQVSLTYSDIYNSKDMIFSRDMRWFSRKVYWDPEAPSG